MMLPLILRLFIGVFIDTQLVTRKFTSIIVNWQTCIFQWFIAFRVFDSPVSICVALTINIFSHQFLEAVCSSFIIQQARGPYRGNEDLQSFKFLIMGVFSTFGAVLGMILLNYEALRMIFGIRGIFYGIAAIQAMSLSSELETNERATIKN